jgi:hypothetical protein
MNLDPIALPIAGVSLFVTTLLLLMLRKVTWNGFIVLIFGLAICTWIRSLSYFFRLIPPNGTGAFLIIEMISDVQCGIWTNFISLTLLRVVYTLKPVNILKEIYYYLFVDISVPLSVGIYSLVAFGATDDRFCLSMRIFYWIRFAVVTINVLCYALSSYFAFNLDAKVSLNELTEAQATAIKVLVFRMQAYPIAQVLTRLGSMWETYDSASYHYPPAEYVAAFTSPAAGIAYFLVFLYIQPTLRTVFFQKLGELWNFLTFGMLPCAACVCACCTGDRKREESRDVPDSKGNRFSNSRFMNNSELLRVIGDDDGDSQLGDRDTERNTESLKERPMSAREISQGSRRLSEMELGKLQS